MSTPRTLLLITTSYPRWANGREAAGSFVADTATALAEHVQIRVVAPGDENAIERVSERLTIYRYAAPQRRLVNLRIWHPADALRILSTLRSGAAAVDAATRDGHVSHMVALWALPSGAWAMRTGAARSIPYSVWMLGSDVWSLGRIPIVRSVLRRVMRAAYRRFADGLQLAEDARRIGGKDVIFLPSTRRLDSSNIPAPAEEPPYRLVFIGRWHPNKGIDLLLDALSNLGEEDWGRISEVHIWGGGPLAPVVQEKANLLLSAGRPLVIGGFIPKDEAEIAILRADYVVIPSRVESIPVIFSDAMKLGRPIVATPVGDLPRLIADAACGVLADQVSAQSLGEAIRSALSTSPRSYASGLRTQAARFDLQAICKDLLTAVATAE